jgi:crotonobetainyl-CoA:carnitine CoA-transferase CaiB-like acyl-CoA transferase
MVRVLEFGSYLAGPLLGKHLANFGFEVTAVVRPPSARGAAAETERVRPMLPSLRAGKRCIELDLTTDLERARDLVRTADVLIENFAPGVLARLGLSFDACRALNPDLVYVSLPGYAEDSDVVRAYDSVIMASTGVFRDMGLNRTLLGVRASFSQLPMPSVYASIFGAYAVLVALMNEQRGVHIRVPLASCLAEALVHNSVHFPIDDCYLSRRAQRVRRGEYPVADASELDALLDPFFAKYTCVDGRPLYVVCPAHTRHQLQLVRAMGIEDEVVHAVGGGAQVDPYATSGARGLGTGNLDAAQSARVRPLLAARFLEKPAMEWERLLASVPVIAHRTTAEWMASEHARASGLVTADGDVAPIGWLTSPEPIVRTASYGDQTLRCVRVLDLSNVIAGPTIGAMLARAGADVIKIDAPRPTYAPEITVIYGVAANVGKRSVLLDLSHPSGREAFEALVRTSDMVLMNSTEAGLVRLRLDAASLRRIHPDVILVHFDAWGGPNAAHGALADRVGYDDNVQAGIGIMARFGGGLETAEEHAHIGTIDVIAGVAAAATAIHALYARKKRGVAHVARSSLVAVGQYLQLPFMLGGERPQLGRGVECRGEHAMHACYEARDGQVLLAACLNASEVPAALAAFGVSSEEALRARFAQLTCSEVCTLCARTGASATPLRLLRDVCAAHAVEAASPEGPSYQFLMQRDHPIGSLLIAAPVAVRMPGLRLGMPPAPKYGAHTREVLAQVHAAKLLLLPSVAAAAWSRDYLPFRSPCAQCGTRTRLVVLRCSHKLCEACLDGKACGVCGAPHEMAIAKLRRNYLAWKRAYNDWRRGASKGARDAHTMFRPDARLRRVHSMPVLGNARGLPRNNSVCLVQTACT